MTNDLFLGTPSARQLEFLQARERFVAFGGARGGGKSWAVRTKAILLCLAHPGIKCMIVRSSYPELQENHILPICALLRCRAEDRALRLADYHDTKKQVTFPNGSRLLFRYCGSDKDADRFQGTEVDALFVDEATQQPEERMKKLNACVRGANAFPKRIYYTCNPGGVGHEWVKRLFLDRRYEAGENPEDYRFIRSLVTDNKALLEADPEYIKRLESLPPKLRKAWLEGDWNIFEGQFFEELRLSPDLNLCEKAGITAEEAREQHRFTHVIPAFDVSYGERKDWLIYRSYDFGYAKPFSCGWWAVDRDGTLYRILELYGCTGTPNEGVKWTPEQQFREIARLEKEHPWLQGREIIGVADPSIWDVSRGESVAEVAMRHGIFFSKGDNRRISGWMALRNRLAFDKNGRAGLYVFENCKDFIRTMPGLIYSKSHPEDLASDGEDHIADESRYLVMNRVVASKKNSPKQLEVRNEELGVWCCKLQAASCKESERPPPGRAA